LAPTGKERRILGIDDDATKSPEEGAENVSDQHSWDRIRLEHNRVDELNLSVMNVSISIGISMSMNSSSSSMSMNARFSMSISMSISTNTSTTRTRKCEGEEGVPERGWSQRD